MKKGSFMAVLLAAALTVLPVSALAADLEPELSLPEAESRMEAGESAPDEESPDGEQISADTDEPEDSAPVDGSAEPEQPESTPEPDPDAPILPGLDREEHRVFIRGSGDLVRPEGVLTRAEAACMIYSLLEYEPDLTGTAAFSDVPAGAWYGTQVLALAEIGAVNGYADGSFHPGANITRGEFVVMLSRFFEKLEDAPDAFTDVAEGYWARQELNAAAVRGWLNGYSDGTFRPDKEITRAEAVAIVNRVLGRTADQAMLDSDGKVLLFLDLPLNHWAYYEIMEAALEHDHLEVASWTGYTVPAAGHAPGYHVIGGELYKVDEKGRWVRNQTDGVLRFNNEGKYTTGDEQLDRKLSAIVRAYTVEGESRENNFHRLHQYVIDHCSYRAGSYMADGQTGWETSLALEMANNGRGNCYRFAALETMLARKMGYQARAISGEIDTDNGFVPHGWTEIDLNGRIYMCDVEIEYVQPDWDLFMKTYSSAYPRYQVQGVRKR